MVVFLELFGGRGWGKPVIESGSSRLFRESFELFAKALIGGTLIRVFTWAKARGLSGLCELFDN
jgi:hypothetical protein